MVGGVGLGAFVWRGWGSEDDGAEEKVQRRKLVENGDGDEEDEDSDEEVWEGMGEIGDDESDEEDDEEDDLAPVKRSKK